MSNSYIDDMRRSHTSPIRKVDLLVFLILVFSRQVGNTLYWSKLMEYRNYLRERYGIEVDAYSKESMSILDDNTSPFKIFYRYTKDLAEPKFGIQCNKAMVKQIAPSILKDFPKNIDMNMKAWRR